MTKYHNYSILSVSNRPDKENPNNIVHTYHCHAVGRKLTQDQMKNSDVSKAVVKNHKEVFSLLPGVGRLETNVSMVVED